MRLFVLLLVTPLFLYAYQDTKIVLETYSTQKMAIKGVKEITTFLDSNLHNEQQQYPFEIALLKSKKYYMLVLKPFKGYTAAHNVLSTIKKVYTSAFISNYPNPHNQLIFTKTLEPSTPRPLPTKPKNTVIQKSIEDSKIIPITLQPEFIKPLSLQDILESSEPKKEHVQETHLQSITPILYFSYFLLTLLIITILLLALTNYRLKRRLQDKQARFSTQNTQTSTIPIDSIELSRYFKTILQHAIKKQPLLKMIQPIRQIQGCVDDIVTISSLIHGESYIKNREFQLSYITQDIAKQHNLIFETEHTLHKTLIGSVNSIERIFLRLSFFAISTITINIISQDDESIELQFILHYDNIKSHPIENELVKQLITSVDGTVSLKNRDSGTEYIDMFTLPFQILQDSNFRVRRP